VIRFYCSCGKRLKVDDSYAGRPVKCGACGLRIEAPMAGEGEESPDAGTDAAQEAAQDADVQVAEEVAPPPPDNGLDELAKALQEAPPPRPARTAQGARTNGGKQPARDRVAAKPGQLKKNGQGDELVRRPAAHNNNKALFIGLGAAAGLILLVVVLMIMMSSGSGPPPKQEDPPVPVTPYKKPAPEHFPGEFFPQVPSQK
jgi:hypothetical protein